MRLFLQFIFILLFAASAFAQNYRIVESADDHIKIEFNFDGRFSVSDTIAGDKKFNYISGENILPCAPGAPSLPVQTVLIGIPAGSSPKLQIINSDKVTLGNKFIIPFSVFDPEETAGTTVAFDRDIYSSNKLYPAENAALSSPFRMRYINSISLKVYPYQFNPVKRELVFNKKIVVTVYYNAGNSAPASYIDDPMTAEFIKSNLVNSSVAVKWSSRQSEKLQANKTSSYWYSPSKEYFKIYLNTKNFYRVTYQSLAAAGLPSASIPVRNLELLNEGEYIPISVTDKNEDGIFNEGDYFEFAGTTAKATPYAYMNIYNNSNVYWFSYQGDSTGLFYQKRVKNPSSYIATNQTSFNTVHLEQDNIYERLGYAPDEKRDYWFWGKAAAVNGVATQSFEARFSSFNNMVEDSHYVAVRIKMHGMTNIDNCSNDHKVYVYINDKLIGDISWDGQTEVVFSKSFYVSENEVRIYPTGNILKVQTIGDGCSVNNNDEIRINWIEFDYWMHNRAGDHYIFSSNPDETGSVRFWTWLWKSKNIKIYIPSRSEYISDYIYDPNQNETIVFTDSIAEQTAYYMISDSFTASVPDSIIKDVSSDYRNTANGADYIILTHSDFKSVAERLKALREKSFPDTSISNPRIFIAYVDQVYDEFSNGMLDPFALKKFLQYTYDNWQKPAPSYVVLLGDMSWDYRKLLPASRPNFVPSIPVHISVKPTLVYGQAVSDISMAMVAGDDSIPDMGIGRLSCETVNEGNILVDKLENYPSDNSKEWKQNVLLISSGKDAADEATFNFNGENIYLENSAIKPLGIAATKIFHFPNLKEYEPYQGGGPEIRAAFNKGAVMANYYGHGGGYLWDLVFTNDDIYLLNNGGRLPVITSTTCYTAHFDNQDVFGEQFVKVPGKGAIAFISSTGLTIWAAGKNFDIRLYEQVFNNRNYILGKAFNFAAQNYPNNIEIYRKQLLMFELLGDPVMKIALPEKPDFSLSSSDISITPASPVLGDTINVKINIRNLGIVFSDSVTVQLFAESPDTSYSVGEYKLSGFGEYDSLSVPWIPSIGGLYQLTVKVNEINQIPENDFSDNSAAASFAVYNINEPNIIGPADGYSTKNNYVNFKFSDISYYVGKNFFYDIEVDTSVNFNSPLIKQQKLSPSNGLLIWKTPALNRGEYFWRSRIYDGENYGKWSSVRGFIVSADSVSAFSARGKLLNLFSTYNVNYSSDGIGSLYLNKELLPPKPDKNRFIEDIKFPTAGIDNLGITTITTDGTYIYFANIWYYSLSNNSNGYSRIHKVGTGNNGTIKGEYYGTLPNFYDKVKNQLFYHSDGFLYTSTGDPYKLLKIDPASGDTSSVSIPGGMLDYETARVKPGAFYLVSDGRYVYNLTVYDTLGNNKYVLRTFDPSNNWKNVKPDMELTGTSFLQGFSSFFVADGYLYPIENYNSNYIRRIRLSDGLFEEEWFLNDSFQSYYAICYDWINDNVYTSVYRSSGYSPKFSKFKGKYADATGTIFTREIGPASKWNDINYKISAPGSNAGYSASLNGYNKLKKQWEVLQNSIPSSFPLSSISAEVYPYLKVNFSLTDSSQSKTDTLKLNSVNLNYSSLPEFVLDKNKLTFSPDSVLQGLPVELSLKIRNEGYVADTVHVGLFLNSSGSAFASYSAPVSPDSEYVIHDVIPTGSLLFGSTVKAVASPSSQEFYSYNNLTQNSFYVARDSVRPRFNITFDGNELVNNDIISAHPEIIITLTDNSPLPLDTSYFTIVHNNKLLSFNNPDIQYSYTPYPNSVFTIKWNPKLEDGEHTLEVLAKDASSNFFDSTSSRSVFYVYNQDDLLNVYNYPNPFRSDTYFTFELRGIDAPEEFRIKIYTVAGRLIRDIEVPHSALNIGFNKIKWDGRDQDGDDIANGLYLYKIISKHNGITKTAVQKLVKLR
jgi:hypothetical protein